MLIGEGGVVLTGLCHCQTLPVDLIEDGGGEGLKDTLRLLWGLPSFIPKEEEEEEEEGARPVWVGAGQGSWNHQAGSGKEIKSSFISHTSPSP